MALPAGRDQVMDIQYRSFDKARDYADQRSLFRLSFPETIATPAETDAHFSWKFESNPAQPQSYQYVAAEPTGVVGYYAAIPFSYSVDGTAMNSGMLCDVMTHPERRGKGIFASIGQFGTGEMKRAGLSFTTAYPIRAEGMSSHLKVGWKPVQSLPLYLRVLGVRSLLPASLRFLSPLLNPVVRLLQAWTLPVPNGYSTQVLTRDEFLADYCENDGEYPRLLAQWLPRQGNALLKGADFLRWRTGAPGTEYLFITLRHDDRLVGLAIARPTQLKNVETLALLDFMVLAEHAKGSTALHARLRQVARRSGKDTVACMCSRQSAKRYRFAGSAYVRSHLAFTLIVKKLDEGIADELVYSESRWQPFWLDSDDL